VPTMQVLRYRCGVCEVRVRARCSSLAEVSVQEFRSTGGDAYKGYVTNRGAGAPRTSTRGQFKALCSASTFPLGWFCWNTIFS